MQTRHLSAAPRRFPPIWFAGLILAAVHVAIPADNSSAQQRAAEPPKELTEQHVGPLDGGMVVPTGQFVRPAGSTFAFAGRPLDMVLSPDGRLAFVKTIDGLIVMDTATWKPLQELNFPKGEEGSMHGIAVSHNGAAVFVSGSHKHLIEARRNEKRRWEWTRQIAISGHDVNPCGIALSADDRTAYVAVSINNTLAIVDLPSGKVTAEIPTGVCPFGVALSHDGQTAFVSNFGGRRARAGEHAEKSHGTPVAVDERSIAMSGTISRIDLKSGKATAELEVGLHPADIKLSSDGMRLFVANANSDSVSVVDPAAFKVLETINVRPDPQLPFGSITNALAVSADGRSLFVANGGNNAVAVVGLSNRSAAEPSKLLGFIPTGWFPGAVCTDGTNLYVVNVKGEGSREAKPNAKAFKSVHVRGSATRVAIPNADQLASFTRQVKADSRVPQMLRSLEAAHSDVKPAPVPARVGEPSTIEHVVYVLKENRCYDQVFGDMPRGNNDPRLCTYGEEVTPNQHALAGQFVLLDNYYCNGIKSADGHQWATQGAVTDYQEKDYGGNVRSYDFGTDALTYANCNFIWDSVLLAGRSFRNYGEFDFPDIVPGNANWFAYYKDLQAKAGKVTFRQSVEMETLRKYTCPTFPGWNLAIPDAVRIEAFLKEFRENEKTGQWPDFVFVYLPQDHTNGTGAGNPTPRAFIADNDLAVGRLVDAISHSRFWKNTAIFINEDDPQDGWDHVDGHRSTCLVVSPYAKRRAVVSQFYNQLSVLHTMERMLGLPSSAQLTAQSPTMEACFVGTPDLSPFTAVPNRIPLDERNGSAENLHGEALRLSLANAKMDFSRPDRIDDDTFNRILWHASKGFDAPYPSEFAGAHGKGLKALNLKLDSGQIDDDD